MVKIVLYLSKRELTTLIDGLSDLVEGDYYKNVRCFERVLKNLQEALIDIQEEVYDHE